MSIMHEIEIQENKWIDFVWQKKNNHQTAHRAFSIIHLGECFM